VAVAHDLHPDYLSTLWAKNQLGANRSPAFQAGQPIELVGVQHHHAHLAACLAENNRLEPALGIIWDGTGYGTDGTIWGGEFLRGDAANFERVAHFRPFLLPGGDAAVKEPRRVALALLWELFGDNALNQEELAPIRHFSVAKRRLLGQMLQKNINSPVTTSAGRLFDGIAALVGLHQTVTFEGQAAMALEFAADSTVESAYPLPLAETTTVDKSQPLMLDWAPLLQAVLADIRTGAEHGVIAARFHNALVEAMVTVALTVAEPVVVLSGGCFQNRLLTERAARRLREAGFEVLLHRQVPPNDGGISLGQIAVAASRFKVD
jgi:hydrogenase maturation protein HypF